ncbi:MAG: YraN family protein [Oscillospiraceae bacterium]|nr:YraN family protein [Oscillospiraceae bacterium]
MADRHDTGRLGEELTVYYLKRSGYRILRRNFRVKGGEVDIIAANDEYIAFVEVRTRDVDAWESGAQTVRRQKRSYILRTANTYLARYPIDLQPRFDIAQVTVKDGKPVKLDYIDNAFGADSAVL